LYHNPTLTLNAPLSSTFCSLSEYTAPLPSPPQRSHPLPRLPGHHSATAHNPLGSRPNPFANFGRFGLDSAGLLGGELEPRASRARPPAPAGDRDGAPHLAPAARTRTGDRLGNGERRERERREDGEPAGLSTSPTSTGKFGVLAGMGGGANGWAAGERGERKPRGLGAGEGAGASTGVRRVLGALDDVGGGVGRRERQQDKEKGRADEGGWRTAGAGEYSCSRGL